MFRALDPLSECSQEARQEVMNRTMELSEVQDGIREAETAAKVRAQRSCYRSLMLTSVFLA